MSQDNIIAFYDKRIAELEKELELTKKALMGRGPQKLDEDKVREIIRLRRAGVTITSVAKQFSIAPSLITGIMQGKYWAHISQLTP